MKEEFYEDGITVENEDAFMGIEMEELNDEELETSGGGLSINHDGTTARAVRLYNMSDVKNIVWKSRRGASILYSNSAKTLTVTRGSQGGRVSFVIGEFKAGGVTYKNVLVTVNFIVSKHTATTRD